MIDGVVIVDKPGGITSHTVVQKVKRLFRARKAGHTGTLDPLATGVLPICINKATKYANVFMEGDKEYEVDILLGVATTTYDIEGDVINKGDIPDDVLGRIEKALPEFRGTIEQVTPYFSAVKYKGRPLYSWARQGRFIDLPPRRVEVGEFEIRSFDGVVLAARVVCSKGTYVRSLCHELGIKIGCGACVKGLRRLATGRFRIKDAVPLERLEAIQDMDALNGYILDLGVLIGNSPSCGLF